MSIINITVKKIFAGKDVSVRDYIWEEAKKFKASLVIHHGKEKMTVPYLDLLDPKKMTVNTFKSKFGGKSYSLLDFIWKPDEDKQEVLL